MENNNVETVEVYVTAELKAAILLLARDYKKGSASDLAEDLLQQVVRGRLKAKREGAATKTGEMWDRMTKCLTAEQREIFPSRQDFVNTELKNLDNVLTFLGR